MGGVGELLGVSDVASVGASPAGEASDGRLPLLAMAATNPPHGRDVLMEENDWIMPLTAVLLLASVVVVLLVVLIGGLLACSIAGLVVGGLVALAGK